MQLHESPLLQPEVLLARPAEKSFDPQAWIINNEVSLRAEQDAILMRQGDRVARLVTGPQSGSMEHQAANSDVLWLLVRAKPNQVGLKCMVPVRATPLNRLDLRVDQRVADDLHGKGRIALPGIPDAIAWLNEEFVLADGLRDSRRVFAVIHSRGDDRKLQLHGRRYQADLTRSAEGPIVVDRIADRPRKSLAPIAVLAGQIGFADASNLVSGIPHLDRTLLDSAVTSYGAYLDLWRLYSEKEWQRDVARAAAISAVRYASFQPISEEGGGWNLAIEQKSLAALKEAWREHSTEDDQVEIDESAPEWTSDHYTDLSAIDKRKRVRARPQFTPGGLLLKTDDRLTPPSTGFVYLSLTGNRTQQERRDNARRAIESGLGVPTLNRLLQDMPLPRQRQSMLVGLSSYAKQSFKAGKATVKQELAIKVALNTPDVALIIGPPGTGKTQVIAALERRLAELNEGHAIAQQVLISSFQHDAVENALGRTDVYGLPAVKIGARRQEAADPVDTWRHRQHAKVAAEIARLEAEEPSATLLEELTRLLNELLIAGASADSRTQKFDLLQELLNQLASVARIRPSLDWQSQWDAYRESMVSLARTSGSLSSVRRQQLTRAVRSLRVLPESFDDDGTQRALLVLRMAQGSEWCTEPHVDVLNRMSDESAPSLAQLEELKEVRDALLDLLRADRRPAKVRKTLDENARRLLGALQGELAAKVAKSRTGAFGVVRQFADALVSQPAWVRRAVENYSSIVGATCQQSASRMMTQLKNVSSDAVQQIQFQSVIVDEAARANPLDLFIPMAMARRRIVLVGDHRQLPHILDPVIEEEIRGERGEQIQADTYQHSLFERLWRQFKVREALDGIPRVVMLDMQFRMHPTLGDFISKHFYEAAGLDKVYSGKLEADFPETVPLYGRVVCQWVDIPTKAGGDERLASGSRVRPAEAIRVAHEVQRLLEQLSPSQSIGVITFYAAQRDQIFQELAKLGLAERGQAGWHIKEEIASNSECPERLRVGTVDAFQGKEFDVVFLSVVRSSGQKLEVRSDYDIPDAFERLASRKYGHLRSANRLNVAMSRQRRLLIAVGDRSMFTGPSAREAVPEMCAFLDLCEKEAARVQ
ncbi:MULTISPECIES: DEAD/DEAH box helicase [unclassified Variovorax]|uniref:DEAD/DEAH box helicase n=1 Tax=unclassified Variovorax TaxID=663243 RepID=UPI001BD65519|nr:MULTISPECIES: AAA domain-containing protein [unclassified Variovorax]